jgi:L-threonylcarbamoyladenylate synthase
MIAPILEPTDEAIARAAAIVRAGGVVVCPSDTNLALTVDPWNAAAVERAFAIKGRPAQQPLTLFLGEPEEWTLYGVPEDREEVAAFVATFWPGPLNIVMPRTAAVPEAALKGSATVSLGCFAYPTPRRLIRAVGRAVAMTSANLSGQADGVLVDLDLAARQIGGAVDLILKGQANGTTMSSTIIELGVRPRILRAGDITKADLNRVRPVFA